MPRVVPLSFAVRMTAFLAVLVVVACTSPGQVRTAVGSAAGMDTRLVGTWELVSTRATRGDTVVLEGAPPAIHAVKILNATDYTVITRRDGAFMRAAGGRYTLSGNTYTEMIDIASTQYAPNTSAVFTIRLDGDTWTTEGGTERTKFREVWRRVR